VRNCNTTRHTGKRATRITIGTSCVTATTPTAARFSSTTLHASTTGGYTSKRATTTCRPTFRAAVSALVHCARSGRHTRESGSELPGRPPYARR
jgi:hypothetical protein